MTGLQAKTILQQTGLAHGLLHQIWYEFHSALRSVRSSILTRNLADHDKDGRLTAEEFIVAMHCCELARAGQALPLQLPEEWLHASVERTDPSAKSDGHPTTYASDESKGAPSEEMTEAERKSAMITYEEKRLKNYEVRLADGRCRAPFAHCCSLA
jgi:intersectin